MKLKDDLAVSRPTVFVSVPRLYNRFYAAMKKGLDDLQGCKKGLATRAYESKKENLENSAEYTHSLWDGYKYFKKGLRNRREKPIIPFVIKILFSPRVFIK